MKMINLEVCANSIASILAAEAGGAVRVEFCDNLSEGGTTPSIVQIQQALRLAALKVNVIIRPRGGDFLYTDNEFEIMKAEVEACGQLGCNGVATGILLADGSIDKPRCAELVSIANNYNMETTFHRAFDRSRDLFESLETIIDLGFKRILTSGGKLTAPEGAAIIKQLIEQAADRIIIMPGSGITEHNIGLLVRQTGLKEFHGSFLSPYPGDMKYKSPEFKDQSEYTHRITDKERVQAAIQNANQT